MRDYPYATSEIRWEFYQETGELANSGPNPESGLPFQPTQKYMHWLERKIVDMSFRHWDLINKQPESTPNKANNH